MQTRSDWEGTRTFFPLFLAMLEARAVATACVVGASDGKFVLPLARRGLRVLAIDRDAPALGGLLQRLAEEGLADRVEIVKADALELPDIRPAEAVWTSCSWHYSVNHRRPLGDFITVLRGLCRAGGLLGAEYMMPVEPRHYVVEHYPSEGAVRSHLPDWAVDWECYTPSFVESPHPGQPTEHVHRMGLIIATRPQER